LNVNAASTTTPRGGPSSSAVPPSTSQQTNAVRPSTKAPSTTANRPTTNSQSGQQQQQQRGNSNYYQQNNRGNYWNDNSQQDHSPARRSGVNVATAPNEQQVFVGSLPLDFTKEILIECFSKFGNVLDAKIHTPSHDNKKVCFHLKNEFFYFCFSIFKIEFWLCRF
jgi:hypothetical protein